MLFATGGRRPPAPPQEEFFEKQGVTVFILKHRLAPPSRNVAQDALADATRAMQIIRSRADEWGIDPHKIGMAGGSAGANLILNTATHVVAGDPTATDPVLRQSSRPDFIALLCVWNVHWLKYYPIGKETPPVIMFHARDDATAPFADAENLCLALQGAGVPVEPHWIPTGGHLIGGDLTPGKPAADWAQLTIDWLKQNGIWPAR